MFETSQLLRMVSARPGDKACTTVQVNTARSFLGMAGGATDCV